MCGCGHIAPRWLEVFSKNSDIELIAIADPNPDEFKKLNDFDLQNVKKYSNLDAVFANHKIDAVFILTPPQYHSRYIIEAIEHGIHVLTEKPLCVDLNQFLHIKKAAELAREKKIITAVNQQYRWNPRILSIHDSITQNRIGDIFLVNSIFNQNNYHFKRWWRKQHSYISIFNWYIHIIDSMRYYLSQKPISVSARFIRPPHSKILGYSSLLMDVNFESGTVWHLTANQESIAGPTTSGHSRFTMYGSEGTLVNTKNDPPYIYTKDGEKMELGENIADIDNESTYPPGWADTVEKFVHSIRTGQEHPTSIFDNLWTMSILLAAIKSHENNREVKISEIFGEKK